MSFCGFAPPGRKRKRQDGEGSDGPCQTENKTMGLRLRRREHQSIIIGDNITVTIEYAENGEVELDIQAPREIPVDRQEVRERKLGTQVLADLLSRNIRRNRPQPPRVATA